MTGRFCEVHGEYAPTGTCRWCEPAPAKYSRSACDDVSMFRGVEYDWTRGPEVDSPEKLARIANARPIDSKVVLKAMHSVWCKLVTRALYGVELRFAATEPVIDAETHAAEESRLLAQHAALRWERVARRWNYKHRNPEGASEDVRAEVWRYWVALNRRKP